MIDYTREIYDCRDQIERDYSGAQQSLPEPWELQEGETEEEYEVTEVPNRWDA